MCPMDGQGQGGLSREQEERICQKAQQFVERWTNRHDIIECRESQTFINEFFDIFDIDRFASNIEFEYFIAQNQDNRRIDVFWPGVILIENKTPGQRFDEAYEQVRIYLGMLKGKNFPEYVLINNFRIFRIYQVQRGNGNLTVSSPYASFPIEKLPEEIHRFYYFLDHKHEKVIKEMVGKSIEKAMEKPIEIEKIVYKTRYSILILASSLSLALGYLISDGQPRSYLEGVIEGSAREASTR